MYKCKCIESIFYALEKRMNKGNCNLYTCIGAGNLHYEDSVNCAVGAEHLEVHTHSNFTSIP